MGGRKRTAEGTILKYSTTGTDNTLETNSDSDNDEPIPRASKRTKHHATATLSWIDSNNQLLKENPFLIPNVLACLCGNSSPQALFKYRLVGQHIWNELAVKAINQDRSLGVRLVKIVDPNRKDKESNTGTGKGVLINIKELISTLQAGKLEHSTLTRIYLNSSVTPNDLNEFLQLNGQNIQTLHYDGHSLKDLRQILKTCAKKLKSLSLWRSWVSDEADKEGLFENDDATVKFPQLESLVIVSGELNPRLTLIQFKENNICNPSKEFLSHVFQSSPNLKSLSVRFFDSFILESGLSFKNLTTLCIKFKIRLPQLRTLCDVGLKLRKLRLQGLYIRFQPEESEDDYHTNDDDYNYMDDPEWMEFRKILLRFLQTQANSLEYFAVSLLKESWSEIQMEHEHNYPHEQWSSMAGFPRMPNLETFILHECSGKIPKEEFSHLFPKLTNLEIVKCCYRQVAGAEQANIVDYPLEIPISPNPSIFVRSIRGIKPTMELAQIFPSVIELHIENEIPHELPIYWPKLKHLYYKDSCRENSPFRASAYIRHISKFLVGASLKESEWIELQGQQRSGIYELTNLELPRSLPSIFNLNELETFEFKFISYEFYAPGIDSALGFLITLGLSKLTHLKKLNFVLEQKPRPNFVFALPQKSLDGLANTFGNRKDLVISTNCDESGRNQEMKKWTLKMNLDHHNSEWKEIDGLFRDDPDIWGDLGLPREIDEEDEF